MIKLASTAVFLDCAYLSLSGCTADVNIFLSFHNILFLFLSTLTLNRFRLKGSHEKGLLRLTP